jgi:molybdopterin molybdotransferase
MINYEEALNAILSNTKRCKKEKVLLKDSIGMILNENIYSGVEMPPFDKSAMDGYAVISRDSRKIPAVLKCIGVIQAGSKAVKRMRKGECIKIMTGAPIPGNADSVIKVEDTNSSGRSVELFKSTRKYENVCKKGEDIRSGMKVVNRGTKILPSHVAVIAACGRKYVSVIKRPRVAIINTGEEIIVAGKKLGRGEIYNSNGPTLSALLQADGFEPVYLGVVKDKKSDLLRVIKKGLKVDVLLISGGVSMGDYDFVPEVLGMLGVRKIFHKVKVKPGKPLFFGKKDGNKYVFGIPGNPVSTYVTYNVFIYPALNKMMGLKNNGLDLKKGIMEASYKKKSGRKQFVLVNVDKKSGKYFLTPRCSHGSGDILSLSRADGIMVVEKDVTELKKKSEVFFFIWR